MSVRQLVIYTFGESSVTDPNANYFEDEINNQVSFNPSLDENGEIPNFDRLANRFRHTFIDASVDLIVREGTLRIRIRGVMIP